MMVAFGRVVDQVAEFEAFHLFPVLSVVADPDDTGYRALTALFLRGEGKAAYRLLAAEVDGGAEPKDYDVLSYVLKNYARLRFSPAVAAAFRQDAANPKRMQREIRRASSGCGVGTKAQQALQLQREEQKLERKTRTREQRDAEKQLKFDRRQQKRKEKHRGR